MLFATLIVLAVAGVLTMLFSSKEKGGSIFAGTTIAAFSTSLLLGILGWNETGSLYGVLQQGKIASIGTIILSVIGLLVTANAAANPNKYKSGPGEFFSFVIFTVLGGVIMVSAHNLLALYLGIELSSYSTYILVGYYRDDRYSNEGASKYFILGALASAFLLFGIGLTYAATAFPAPNQAGIGMIPGSFDYQGIANNLNQALNPLIWPALALIIVGFGFKLALVPFHSWTPDAYQGAPSLVAALLSVGPKAASIIALSVLLTTAFPLLSGTWSQTLIWLAIITMTVGNLQALRQRNIKRLLGYSSVAQLGYVIIGLAVANTAGLSALIFYVAGYAFTNIGAFATISALRDAGISDEIDSYAGLVKRSPIAAILLAGFFLSLAGVPLFAGFFGKLFVFKAAVDAGLVALAIVAVINAVFAYYYYFRVIISAFLAEPNDKTPIEINSTALTGLTVALFGVLIIGVFPDVIKEPINQALGSSTQLQALNR